MERYRKPSKSTCLVLVALLNAKDGQRYGYAVMQETGLRSGTLYPILMRLKSRGFLTAEWGPPETEGRPPRQTYALTDAGKRYAREALAEAETVALVQTKGVRI